LLIARRASSGVELAMAASSCGIATAGPVGAVASGWLAQALKACTAARSMKEKRIGDMELKLAFAGRVV